MNSENTLGEAGILARILPLLGSDPRLEVGPGDDAAVLSLPSRRLVVTTDTMVEGQDFLPGATTATWIGRKAAVQNLADVAAMGARPVALVVSLSTPQGTPPTFYEDLTRGLAGRAQAEGASIVGGDLGRAEQLSITVTALGTLAEGEEAVLRSGARAGQVLAVGSPRLGRSGAGLDLVLAGEVTVVDGRACRREESSLPVEAEELVAWHDAPDPELSLGWRGGRWASAMLDVSDGLVRDAGRIALASGVSIDLDEEALRPDARALAALAAQRDADPWDWVLHGGEEHAMLATFPAGDVPEGFRRIGRVVTVGPGRQPEVLLGGQDIRGTGFDHFA